MSLLLSQSMYVHVYILFPSVLDRNVFLYASFVECFSHNFLLFSFKLVKLLEYEEVRDIMIKISLIFLMYTYVFLIFRATLSTVRDVFRACMHDISYKVLYTHKAIVVHNIFSQSRHFQAHLTGRHELVCRVVYAICPATY